MKLYIIKNTYYSTCDRGDEEFTARDDREAREYVDKRKEEQSDFRYDYLVCAGEVVE